VNHSLVEPYLKLLEPIRCFLLCPTPQKWIQQAAREENLPVILLDHLHCELNDIVSTYKLFISKG
jgi:tRNA-(ms[2]io[6]A)-hydroxylase